MYLTSIPINCYKFHRTKDKNTILDELKAFDADRVMLNFESMLDGHIARDSKEEYEKQICYMKEACDFFKSQGYEVGAWFWGLQFDKNLGFREIKTLQGRDVYKFACPTDERFLEFFASCLKDVAKTGVDIILLNDDLRFGAWGGFGCVCEKHIEMIENELGEKIEETGLKDLILSGGKNKYRDAFLKANRESLENYAKVMRLAVDEVNPEVRLGFCACMTSWDIDGDAFRLAKIFAGNTKPMLRLIGAPYWAASEPYKHKLQGVIELERMEASWNYDPDIELIAEGDAYPRPRISCGASYIEGFDTALRASGALDGILKITVDYVSDPGYEAGYLKKYIKNKPVYKAINQHFAGKKSIGVRIYESMKKAEIMSFPNALGGQRDMEDVFYSSAAKILTANSIPTVYEGCGVTGVAFGENAYHLTEENFKKGLVIDALAAKILTGKGIDVGIEEFGEREKMKYQYFKEDGNYIIAPNCIVSDVKLRETCKILSYATGNFESQGKPLCYLYENDSGQRFLVFTCIAREGEGFLKQHGNGKIIADNVLWLSGEKLPAYSYGNPNLYIQCKEDEESVVIGIWNFFEDEAIEPVIFLGREYKNADFLFGEGSLSGDKAVLEDIEPFGFRAIVLKK